MHNFTSHSAMEKVKSFLKEFPSMSVNIVAYQIGLAPDELQGYIDGVKPIGTRLLGIVNLGVDRLRLSLIPQKGKK